jgi:uncharacterized membrane protein HdeD (DUF308 family)
MTMSSLIHQDPLNPKIEECLRLEKCWGWFLCLGIILMVVGVMAIGAAFIATLTTIVVFGSLLIAGGVVQIVNAFLARNWGGFMMHLMAGILHLVVGGLMIEQPERAAEGLTLMLAAAFLIGGIFRLVAALRQDFTGRTYVLTNAVITILLGVAIWRRWPESSDTVIGLFVGIDMLFNGSSWVILGLIVKGVVAKAPHKKEHGQPQVPVGASPAH